GSARTSALDYLPIYFDSQVQVMLLSANPAESVNYRLTIQADPVETLTYEEERTGLAAQTGQATFDFEGQRGDVISVRVEGDPASDLTLTLFRVGDGLPLAEDDDSGAGYLPELLAIQLAENATYRVEVRQRGIDLAPTEFTISVERVASRLVPGEELELVLPGKLHQNVALAIFEAEAGQTYDLTVLRDLPGLEFAGPDALLRISVLQNGRDLAALGFNQETELSTRFVVPEAGEVLVSVNRTFFATSPNVLPTALRLRLAPVN
ncbi:MAG: hypothetical protein HC915_16430, partial [Anaerolineae bacterium]|nr:hypothetical protein [Anaerolineae bacterium]